MGLPVSTSQGLHPKAQRPRTLRRFPFAGGSECPTPTESTPGPYDQCTRVLAFKHRTHRGAFTNARAALCSEGSVQDFVEGTPIELYYLLRGSPNFRFPESVEFFGRPFTDKTLFDSAYAYEQATLNRSPPDDFGALFRLLALSLVRSWAFTRSSPPTTSSGIRGPILSMFPFRTVPNLRNRPRSDSNVDLSRTFFQPSI